MAIMFTKTYGFDHAVDDVKKAFHASRRIIAGLMLAGPLMFSTPGADLAAQDNQEKKGQSPALASIEMKSIYFNMIHNGVVEGAVAVDLVLLINDDADIEDINRRLPQLRSDFLGALLALSKRRFRIDTPPNVDSIKTFLTPVAAKRLGAGKVQVFVKNATITPNKD